MVRLIRFEYRKHFIKPSILLAVLIFSVVSIVKIYGVYAENSMFARGLDAEGSMRIKQLYWEMYGEFAGDITLEKIERLLAIYRPLEAQTADMTASTATDNPDTYTGNIYHDYFFFDRCFVRPMEHAYTYRSYANQVVSAAQENMAFYQAAGNPYEYRKNAAIARCFAGRRVGEFAFTEMYRDYLHYDFSSFLALLICLYGLVGVFVSEKEIEMDALLLTTRRGGSKTVAAKLLSSALFVTGVCAWFWLLDFLAFGVIFGSFEGATAPLYAVKNFSDTALNLTLGQYALLSGFVKTAGMLVLGMGVLLLSSLFKNALFPFAFSLSGAFGLIYRQTAFMGSARIWEKALNPFALMVNRDLFRKAEFANLCGFPIPSYAAALLSAALWSLLLAVILMATIRKSTVAGKGGR